MKTNKISHGWRYYYNIIKKILLQQKLSFLIDGHCYQRIVHAGKAKITQTLHLEKISEVTDLFRISLNIREELTEDGTTIIRRHAEQWLAIYSLSTKRLIELGGLRAVAFHPEDGRAYLEKDEFQFFKVLPGSITKN